MTRDEGRHSRHVDGNVLAGPLAEIFTADVTAAHTECTHCGSAGPVAMLLVYADAPGLVARCQQCGEVVLRYVRTTDTGYLDMRGTVALSFAMPPS
jgi:DNA-directed RNA polymerase subunit RPC12/RpoP